MADDDNLNLSLTCAICLDVASVDDAVETSCCHHLFCSTCIENVRICPACRQEDFKVIPAYFARRLIGNLVVKCPNDGCTEKITRSNLSKHLSVSCTSIQVTCPDPQCQNFKCTKKEFIEHLTDTHGQLLLENFAKLWQKQESVGRGTVIREAEKTPERVGSAAAAATAASNSPRFDDRLERTRNIFGRYARLGSTGKFYCEGALDGPRCSCCNGRCGPSNGCNCSGCMLLDVQKQQLPPGWLVNREGASARCSPRTPTKFYCGRMVMTHDRRTDGYCGPTDGEQCNACLRLNEQQFQRYGQVWRQ